MRVQLKCIQLITDKTNKDISSELLEHPHGKKLCRHTVPGFVNVYFCSPIQFIKNWQTVTIDYKGSIKLYCVFVAADSVKDAIRFSWCNIWIV